MEIRATLRLRNNKMITARNRLGLNQFDAAFQANVPCSFLQRCEKLDYPKMDCFNYCFRLAVLLTLNPDDIIPSELQGHTIPSTFVATQQIDTDRLLEYKATFDSRNILPSPDIELQDKEMSANVMKALGTLSFREREILKLVFGLEGVGSYTLTEVAKIFKVTTERVRQVEARALRKLNHPARAKILRNEDD